MNSVIRYFTGLSVSLLVSLGFERAAEVLAETFAHPITRGSRASEHPTVAAISCVCPTNFSVE